MNKSRIIFLTVITLIFSTPVWSHTDDYFDSVDAPHGGQMRMAGPYHLEIVTKDKEIALYVTDHANTKISINGGVSKAIFQTGETKTTVKLEPACDNVFKGTGDFMVTPETKVIVFVRLPEQEAQAARFTPLKPAELGNKSKQSLETTDSHADFHDQHGDDHSDHQKMHH
ncbi:MAG: hypothetical protein E4H07_09865 [Nitrosomonadales bacterium]|jgi:hypothetical protein|nr:MAG: hypothetical protein E4H07_09865 [Nitrosomonadales bacterium]